MYEVESSRDIVKTAWELGVSRNLLHDHYDKDKLLCIKSGKLRRKNATSARDALNGNRIFNDIYKFIAFWILQAKVQKTSLNF